MDVETVTTLLNLPTDIWTHILENLVVYDVLLLRTANKQIFKICNPKLPTSNRQAGNIMQYFAEIGSIPCLEYCRGLGMEWDANTIAAAAHNGQLEVIKFLDDNECDYDEHACGEAAANGHLECLKYLHENDFPWDESTTETAARSDQLEALKYLRENGCPWGSDILRTAAYYSFDCLKYALDNGCPSTEHWIANRLCRSAASGGKLDCLKYLFEAGFSLSGSCEAAAQEGYLECMKYAQEHLPGDWGDSISNAAHRAHLECIKYALQNGAVMNSDSYWPPMRFAAVSGSIECVKLLREHGGLWCGAEYDVAADNRDLPMIKYLLEVAGCPKPITNIACMSACGSLEVLKYLHENGFRWDGVADDYDEIDDDNYDEDVVVPSQTIAFKAVQCRALPSLQYILECGYELDTSDLSLVSTAASNNDIDMLEFLLSLNCEAEPAILSAAARSGALKALKHLRENYGFEWDDSAAILAAEFGRSEVLEYALKNGCGYSSLVCSAAARGAHLECLKIAHKFGVPWTASACLATVKQIHHQNKKYFNCLKYLHENGCPWTHQECTEAVSMRNLQLLNYLHENGCEWNKQTWYAAVEADDIACLEYLFENGCPQDPQTFTMTYHKKCYEFIQKNIIKTPTTLQQ